MLKSVYTADGAETEEMASIIGDKLQLKLYISPEICISFLHVLTCGDWLRKGNRG